MKPSSLAVVPQDVKAADSAFLERERVLHRAIDEVYFRVPLEPADALFPGIVIDAANYGVPIMDMPAGAPTGIAVTRRPRDLWPHTTLRFNLWYTSPVGSTNNFTVITRVFSYDVGALLTGFSTPITSGTFTIPGPAVANTILFATRKVTTLFPSVPAVVGFNFARIAPDANANDLRVLFGEFVLEESA